MERCVAVAFSPAFSALCDSFPPVAGRTGAAFTLLQAYDLFRSVRVFTPRRASEQELCQFHCEDYVASLKAACKHGLPDDHRLEQQLSDYGLGYDCPLFELLYQYASTVVGASIGCAELLASGQADVAVNLAGGWHHAGRYKAAGYCYLNDCVLAILKLRETFSRVLYIDLDAHHGDGVESAFAASRKVMTVSLHMHEAGFYPGSGSLEERGIGRGVNYALNVPLRQGLSDAQFRKVFDYILPTVCSIFEPQVVVMQLGVDGVSQDPMMTFNLTPASLCHALRRVLDWRLPLLCLGGGGYGPANFAKCWARFLSTIIGTPLAEDIPEHSLFPLYGPDFSLNIYAGSLPNTNTDEYLNSVIDEIRARYAVVE